MAGTDSYDYTTDTQFLQAPPEQQHAYLTHVDPEYAQAHPDQQKAYLGHINGGPYSEKGALSNPPVAPAGPTMNKVEPLTGGQVTPEEEQSIQNRAAKVRNTSITPVTDASSIIMPVAGAMGATKAGIGRGLNRLARGTVGAAGGAAAGSYAGGALGNIVGHREAGSKIGGLVGGLSGGIIGGGSLPEESQPFDENLPVRAHAEMDQDIAKGQQQRAGAKAEMEKDFATRAAKTPQSIAERGLAVGKAKSTLVSGRPFEQLNEQEQAEALMRRGKEQGAIDEGTTEGSSQKVTKIPEPGPVPPGENPNNQQSVPRRTTLVQNAKRGKEGAGTQLNQIHGPVLYEPKGAGYSGVREQIPISGESPTVKGSSEGTIGSGPIKTGKPGLSEIGKGQQARADLHAKLEKDTGISVHDFVDNFMAKNPNSTRGHAYDVAEETLRDASPSNVGISDRETQAQATERINRIMGPEQRKIPR